MGKTGLPGVMYQKCGLMMIYLDSALANWHIPELPAELRGAAGLELEAVSLRINQRLAQERDAENRSQIQIAVSDWVYDLVHKGLFAGYINWDDGLLISRDAAQLRGNKCPNCGGEVDLAGKGVIQCPYCGAEIFLTD